MTRDPVSELRNALQAAIETLGADSAHEPTLERPKRAEQGHYATNAAMLLAPGLGENPRSIAERLAAELRKEMGDWIEEAEVAGPGFLNLSMSDSWHRQSVARLLDEDVLGSARPRERGRVNLEFVSANPTGPLTAAGGRGAAYGDSLARLLEAAGHEVEREYYLNDAGSQIRAFAASIAARMRGTEPPEDGYAGAYISDLAAELEAEDVGPDDLEVLERRGAEAMRARIEGTLERFGVRFDTWASERELDQRGALRDALTELEESGATYRADDALWLRTTAHGDDKDRVLVRSNGEPTYFGADVAYHRDKLAREAGLMIVPLGADHHGYVPRMRAAIAYLAGDPDRYEAPIMQLVNIVERGERARMSKRKGDFVTLDELIDDIGVDAARFFLLQRSHDTVIDLDLELARSQSQDNPVYYVQYAHARIASILRKAEAEKGVTTDNREFVQAAGEEAALAAPCEPAERALIRRLIELPGEVEFAAERRAPHRLCAYATAAAADFHAFYRDCKVVDADVEADSADLETSRLGVCLAARDVLARTLGLLGVSAPERM